MEQWSVDGRRRKWGCLLLASLTVADSEGIYVGLALCLMAQFN